MLPTKTHSILGVPFPSLSYQACLSLFQNWIESKSKHQVCIANVHTVVTALSDTELLNINHQSLMTMDGLPLVWYAKKIHKSKTAERVCGPELMLRCLEHGQSQGWKHFFLGGKNDVLVDLVATMQTRYPKVNIVGWYSPPFRALTPEEDAQLIDQINAQQPDFLWVGLGAPKQEKWIAAHIDKITASVQLGVGAAFDFHSGHIKRAPVWMQKVGLEWFYRLLQDKRLFKRYLETNPIFIKHFIKDYLKSRFSKQSKQTI